MKKTAFTAIILFYSLASLAQNDYNALVIKNSEEEKILSAGVSLLYGWYYQSFTVSKGDMREKYIKGVADFHSDSCEFGGGVFISIFNTVIDLSYIGSGGLTFGDVRYKGLSFTIDSELWRFPWSKYDENMNINLLHEIHVRYKHNRVSDSKIYGNYQGITGVEQDYYSNWYNVALVYNYCMFHVTKGSPYIDANFWGGLSSGGFNYNSGLEWRDLSSNNHRNETFIKSAGFYPGINIGFDVTFGSDYDRGIFINLGIDSIFVFDAPVKSSVAEEEKLLLTILEFKVSAEYRFSPLLRVTVSAARTLNQSVSIDANYTGIAFTEESRYYQAAISIAF